MKKCLLTTNFFFEMRTLVYTMTFNLFPVRNLTNLSHPRALFLHDLSKKKDIDICAHIYYLLEKCVSKRTSRMTIPFSGLIMSIMQHERVHESSISVKTLMPFQTPKFKLRLNYFYSNLSKCRTRVNKMQ